MTDIKIKVLVIDDHEDLTTMVRDVLESRGYEVLTANTGERGLEIAFTEHPDLILLDVMMPQMSGYDLCQRVRENPAWQGIRIVMLSAKGRDIEVTKGLAVGADAYVTKPFSTKDLIAKVQELLGE